MRLRPLPGQIRVTPRAPHRMFLLFMFSPLHVNTGAKRAAAIPTVDPARRFTIRTRAGLPTVSGGPPGVGPAYFGLPPDDGRPGVIGPGTFFSCLGFFFSLLLRC